MEKNPFTYQIISGTNRLLMTVECDVFVQCYDVECLRTIVNNLRLSERVLAAL